MARDYGALYPVARAVLTPLFKLNWRVHTSGVDHVPERGGAIICPNHVSVLDSFFVPLVLPRRITYVGKAEYMDDWKTKFIFPAMGMVPIDRAGGDAAQSALDTASAILESGELFGIYPEGTRSRSGNLHRGHTGAARLALRTGSPILPVGLIGTREVQPPDAKFPQPFRPVWIKIGRPVDPGKDLDRMGDHRLLRQITDEVMFEIGALSGQTYVDEYANKKPEEADIPRQRGGVITADGPQTNGHPPVAAVAKAG